MGLLIGGAGCLSGFCLTTFACFAGTAWSPNSISFSSSGALQQLKMPRNPPLRFFFDPTSPACCPLPAPAACFELLLAKLPLLLFGFRLSFDRFLPKADELLADWSGIELEEADSFDWDEERLGTLGVPRCWVCEGAFEGSVCTSRLLTASVLEEGSNAVIPNWAGEVARLCAESGKVLTAGVAVSNKALATSRARSTFL